MLYVLCWVLDFCRLKTPDAVLPFAAVSESAEGKAWSMGVSEPVGGGGGGVVEGGGGGGVVEGGGGGGVVLEGCGGGGGGVVLVAVTVVVTGIRQVVDTPGPACPI